VEDGLKRRVKRALKLSAEEAQRALQVLVSEGKIATRDVLRAIERRQKLIGEIRERLAALGDEGTKLASRLAKDGPFPMLLARGRRASREGKRRGRRAISAATRAAYRAQGRYMAAVRPLSKALRRQVKAIRKKSGVNAAIGAAKKLARKKTLMRHTREG
jgi:hypothetical protein